MAPSGRLERFISAMPAERERVGKLENWHRVGTNSAGSLRDILVIGLDNGGVVKKGGLFKY